MSLTLLSKWDFFQVQLSIIDHLFVDNFREERSGSLEDDMSDVESVADSIKEGIPESLGEIFASKQVATS